MSATSTFGDSGDVIRSELKFLRQSLEISKLKHDGKKQRQIEDEMKKLTMRLKATNPNQNGRDPQLPPRVSQAKLRDGGSSESVKVSPQREDTNFRSHQHQTPQPLQVASKDIGLMIQQLKQQFDDHRSQPDQSVDILLETLIIHVKYELIKDVSDESLIDWGSFQDLTKATLDQFDQCHMLTTSIQAALEHICQRARSVEEHLLNGFSALSDAFRQLRIMTSVADRLFYDTFKPIAALDKFFQHGERPDTSVTDIFQWLSVFVSEHAVRTNYASNDLVVALQQTVDDWNSFVETKRQHLIDLLSKCSELLGQVKSIDFRTLINLLKLSNKATQCLTNELAVFFIGTGGVGKTLLIHLLKGSQVNTIRTSSGGIHYEPNSSLNNPLIDFVVKSPDNVARSGPSSMNVLQISLRDKSADVWMVDTPAIYRDAEIVDQLACAASIVGAMRRCKRAKIVMCLKGEQVLEGLRTSSNQQLFSGLYDLFSNSSDRLSMIYVISHCSYPDRISLADAIKSKATPIPASTAKVVLVDLIDKLRSSAGAHIIKPNDPNSHKQLLRELSDFDHLAIHRPFHAFNDFISATSKEKLSKQFRLHQAGIQRCLQVNDVKGLRHTMDQLYELADLLAISDSLQAFSQAVHKINASLTTCLESIGAISESLFIHRSEWSIEMEMEITDFILKILVFDNFYKEQVYKIGEFIAEEYQVAGRSFTLDMKRRILHDLDTVQTKYFLVESESCREYFDMGVVLSNAQQLLMALEKIKSASLKSLVVAIEQFKARVSDVLGKKVEDLVHEFVEKVKAWKLSNALAFIIETKRIIVALHLHFAVPSLVVTPNGIDVVVERKIIGQQARCQQYTRACEDYVLACGENTLKAWQSSTDLLMNKKDVHSLIHVFTELLADERFAESEFSHLTISKFLNLVTDKSVKVLEEVARDARAALTVKDIFAFHNFNNLMNTFLDFRQQSQLLSLSESIKTELNRCLEEFTTNLYDACRKEFNKLWTNSSSGPDVQILQSTFSLLYCSAVVNKSEFFESLLQTCLDKFTGYTKSHDWSTKVVEVDKPFDVDVQLEWKTRADKMLLIITHTIYDQYSDFEKEIRDVRNCCGQLVRSVDANVLNNINYADQIFGGIFEALKSSSSLTSFRAKLVRDASDCGEHAMKLLSSLIHLSHPYVVNAKNVVDNVKKGLVVHYKRVDDMLHRKYQWLILHSVTTPTIAYDTKESFEELENGLQHLFDMHAVHSDPVAPLKIWLDILKVFHQAALYVAQNLPNEELHNFAAVVAQLGRCVDKFCPADTSFNELSKQMVGARNDALDDAIVAIQGHDYRKIARSLKLLGLGNPKASRNVPMSAERENILNEVKMMISSQLDDCVDKIERFNSDPSILEMRDLWQDLVELNDIEVFLAAFTTDTAVMQTWNKIRNLVSRDMKKVLVGKSKDAKEFSKKDLVGSLIVFRDLREMISCHNCYNLVCTSALPSACSYCTRHNKPVSHNLDGVGPVSSRLRDDLVSLMNTVVQSVDEVIKPIQKKVEVMFSNAGELHDCTTKEEFLARLPPMSFGSAEVDDIDANTTSEVGKVMVKLEEVFQLASDEVQVMLTRIKEIEKIDLKSTTDYQKLKDLYCQGRVLYKSRDSLPKFKSIDLQKAFKKDIKKYFDMIRSAIQFVIQREHVSNRPCELELEEDDEDDVPNPSGSSRRSSGGSTNKPAVPIDRDAEEAKIFRDSLSDDAAQSLKILYERYGFWSASKFFESLSSPIEEVLLIAQQALEDIEKHVKVREQCLVLFHNHLRLFENCLKTLDCFSDLEKKHPNKFKLFSSFTLENVSNSLRTILSAVYEHLAKLMEDAKKLEGLLSSVDRASDLNGMSQLVKSLKLMSEVKALFRHFTTFRKYQLAQQIKEINGDAEVVVRSIEQSTTTICSFLQQLNFVNADTQNANTDDREGYYLTVRAKYEFFLDSKWLHNADVSGIDRVIQDNIRLWYERGAKSIQTSVARIELKVFNLSSVNLESIATIFKSFEGVAKTYLDDLENALFHKIDTDLLSRIMSSRDDSEHGLQDLADCLTMLFRLGQDATKKIAQRIKKSMDELLNKRSNAGKNVAVVQKVGDILDSSTDGSGQEVISSMSLLEGYFRSKLNERFTQLSVEQMLDDKTGLSGDDYDKASLKLAVEQLRQEYRAIVEAHLRPQQRPHIVKLPQEAINLAKSGRSDWNSLIHLIALIFAYWSLNDTSHFDSSGGNQMYLLQPHLGQLLAILRLFGFGSTTTKTKTNGLFNWSWFGGAQTAMQLQNHLVQVRTGEGKSVILGVMSIALGLMGFEIDCVCYSKHLSERDYEEFVKLFQVYQLVPSVAFPNIDNVIHYGTFNELCEAMLNSEGNIRDMVETAIKENSNTTIQQVQANAQQKGKAKASNPSKPKRDRILLIDEVDVFFQPGFYGSVYNIFTTIKASEFLEVQNLIMKIWSFRSSSLSADQLLQQVKRSDEFTLCASRFSNWSFLIEEAIKDMLSTLAAYRNHEYHFDSETERIGYLDSDNTISYKMVKGYNTMFAYLKEYENKSIKNPDVLKNNLNVLVHVATFSYAEFPKKYSGILGVSGTLTTLSAQEKRILSVEYKVEKFTFLPSAYGRDPILWSAESQSSIQIVDEGKFLTNIVDEIKRRQGEEETKRPVLVFFRCKADIEVFRDSDIFASYRDQALVLYAGMKEESRKENIRKAMETGRVSLLTREFGRGTNFHCKSKDVEKVGGIHVISTFISEEVSEEVQIMGRTARQGCSGSFSMVLSKAEMGLFKISESELETMMSAGKRYSTICAKRLTKYDEDFPRRLEFLEQMLQEHIRSEAFVESLRSGDMGAVLNFLTKKNSSQYGEVHSRTIILLDATYSMDSLLEQAKQTVSIMLERVSEILLEQNMNSGFQIQFAVYRNYNSHPDKLLEVSTWESTPANLLAFIMSVKPDGGWGNEAIEVGLWHANQEAEKMNITQVILIGDAAPNTRAETDEKREPNKKLLKKSKKYAQPVYFEDELQAIVNHNIRVHAFYIQGCSSAKRSFKEIADKTKGKCEALDVKNKEAASILAGTVSTQILEDIGTKLGGDMANKLVSAYKEKFPFQSVGFI